MRGLQSNYLSYHMLNSIQTSNYDVRISKISSNSSGNYCFHGGDAHAVIFCPSMLNYQEKLIVKIKTIAAAFDENKVI